jgi:hypothetical protein
MKHLVNVFRVVPLFLLFGCGGGYEQDEGGSGHPIPLSVDVGTNWELSLASTVSGAPPIRISGSVALPGTSLMHVDGSTCFDPMATVGLGY